MRHPRIDLVVGTRPEAIKLAPVAAALVQSGLSPRLIFTGQHPLDPFDHGLAGHDRVTLDCPGKADPMAHSAAVGAGRLSTTLAANFNRLTIGDITTTDKLRGKEDTYFDLREQYFVRASAPPSKINLTLDYGIGKWNFVARAVRFGEIKLANWDYDEAALDVYSPKVTTDLTVAYRPTRNLGISVGGSNIFNVYPDMSSPILTESGGAWDPVQMGSNGAFWFVKANIRF